MLLVDAALFGSEIKRYYYSKGGGAALRDLLQIREPMSNDGI